MFCFSLRLQNLMKMAKGAGDPGESGQPLYLAFLNGSCANPEVSCAYYTRVVRMLCLWMLTWLSRIGPQRCTAERRDTPHFTPKLLWNTHRTESGCIVTEKVPLSHLARFVGVTCQTGENESIQIA